MTIVRVPIHRTSPTQTVQVESGATAGATLGVNLRWPDGRVVQPGDLVTAAGGAGGSAPEGPDTTDALDEGRWNLYFTARRAQDAVGSILADSANVTLSYMGGESAFPTSVGVFLPAAPRPEGGAGLPHAHGGVSSS